MLSIKGREPFIRMHLWLNDPHKVEKLHALKDNLKRKRESLSISESSNPVSPLADTNDPYGSSVSSPGSNPSAAKKTRVLFSTRQKEALKIAYTLDPYPSPSTIEFLSQELNLETRSIINWFHNHRMRLKQLSPHDTESILNSVKEDLPAKQFDYLQFKILVNQRLLDLGGDLNEPTQPESPASSTKQEIGESCLDLRSATQRNSDATDEDSRQSFGREMSLDGDDADVLNRSRSRRKPLAPQWVNPAVREDQIREDEEDNKEIMIKDTDDSESVPKIGNGD